MQIRRYAMRSFSATRTNICWKLGLRPSPCKSIYCIACRKTGVGDTKRKSQTRKIEEALARNAGANLERNTAER